MREAAANRIDRERYGSLRSPHPAAPHNLARNALHDRLRQRKEPGGSMDMT